MKKTLKIVSTVAAVLVSLAMILAPLGLLFGTAAAVPSQYSDTFYGALDLKYDRLKSIDQDKIVVVGGSSVAFGLDSALVEQATGMPVVNFGLYADLGTRLMLDLSRDHIKDGDIVIIAPELDPQTLSMYFSWQNTLKAFDDDMSMLFGLNSSVDEWLFSVGDFWKFDSAKLQYWIGKNTPNPDGVYNANNFNEYGDIDPSKFPRENNVMPNQYLVADNYLVDLEPSIMEKEFLDYLNDYIDDCQDAGAAVFFTWCPVNNLSVVDDTPEKRTAFEKYFEEKLHCNVIGDIDDYIIDWRYFYDTNFHLNDAGVTVRTVRLVKDLLERIAPDTIVELPAEPPMPGYNYSTVYDGKPDENTKYFTFEQLKNGAFQITGLTELGKQQTKLTVPLGYRAPDAAEAYKVTVLDTNIFGGSACEELIITEESNLSLLGSFKGAGKLRAMYIYIEDPGMISKPDSFSGVSADFKVYVPAGKGYPNHYNWGTGSSVDLLVEM